MSLIKLLDLSNFNSHAHVERDDSEDATSNTNMIISTHTLTWSVTFPLQFSLYHLCNFNSHAHVERDETVILNFPSCLYFNSHAHVERDEIQYFHNG